MPIIKLEVINQESSLSLIVVFLDSEEFKKNVDIL